MRNGDIVRHKGSGKIGMITWRKNNQQIGVNFGHYPIVKATNPDYTEQELIDHVRKLGADDEFSKEEIELL